MSEKINQNSSPEKKGWLDKIDEKAELKGEGIKTLWQVVKFVVVSCGISVLQLILANTLPLVFDRVTATIPAFLQNIFVPDALFDVATVSGAENYALYVVGGVVTWGYVLPFFLSNGIANIVGYIENKKRTFKSDAPTYCFVIYIIMLVCLILFSTWLQSAIFGWLTDFDNSVINSLARTIASLACGLVQMLVLFPMEKFVLLKEKK